MKSLKFLMSLVGLLMSTFTFGVVTGEPIHGVVAWATFQGVSLAGGFNGMGISFANFITGTPITFNGEEAKDGILDPAFEKPAITLFHRIVPGIVAKKQVAFLHRINKITKKDAGCGTGITDSPIPPTEKFWNPTPLKIWLQQCASDLEATFYTWALGTGVNRKDLSGTDFEDYVLEMLPDAVQDDALRVVWFGDTAAAVNAGGGKLLNASDVANYNQLDGFWKKIFAGVAGATIKRVTITENGNASFALQMALAADTAYNVFKGLLTGDTDPRLKSRSDKVIICTTSLYENWLEYKETKNIDRSFERQSVNYQTDVYRGVTIVAFDLWDRFIQADFQNGTVYYLPHRAVLTTKENLQVGLDTANIDQFKVFYDDVTELHNFKGGYKVDVQIPYDFLIKVAY